MKPYPNKMFATGNNVRSMNEMLSYLWLRSLIDLTLHSWMLVVFTFINKKLLLRAVWVESIKYLKSNIVLRFNLTLRCIIDHLLKLVDIVEFTQNTK